MNVEAGAFVPVFFIKSFDMDVEVLSRIQFAFTIAFHYVYPPLSIGLGLILVIMEGIYLRTHDKVYEEMTRFWIRIFAIPTGVNHVRRK